MKDTEKQNSFYDPMPMIYSNDKYSYSKEYHVAYLLNLSLRANGINVFQYKVKFDQIRIYVDIDGDEENKIKLLKIYREQYLFFKRLFPDMWKALSTGADYSNILFDTAEEFEEDICKTYSRFPELRETARDIFYKLIK